MKVLSNLRILIQGDIYESTNPKLRLPDRPLLGG